jgi:hypothetical protein
MGLGRQLERHQALHALLGQRTLTGRHAPAAELNQRAVVPHSRPDARPSSGWLPSDHQKPRHGGETGATARGCGSLPGARRALPLKRSQRCLSIDLASLLSPTQQSQADCRSSRGAVAALVWPLEASSSHEHRPSGPAGVGGRRTGATHSVIAYAPPRFCTPCREPCYRRRSRRRSGESRFGDASYFVRPEVA